MSFPFYEENELFEQIRLGERERAVQMLRRIRASARPLKGNLLRMLTLQLLTVMTRAAAFGGADLRRLAVEHLQVYGVLEGRTGAQIWRELERTAGRFCAMAAESRSVPEVDLIVWAKEYIEQHKGRKITVSEVAVQLMLSTGYFGRLFKRETGYTFTEYLNRVRLRSAVELLESTGETIQGVARKVGFTSVQYFCTVFRQHVGMTPSQYRTLSEQGAHIERRF